MDAKTIASFLTAAQISKIKTAEANVQYHADNIESYGRAIPEEERRSKARIKEFEDLIALAKQGVINEKANAEKLQLELEKKTKSADKEAKLIASQLEKHKGIESAIVFGEIIEITTPLVWVKIRKEAGSRDTERTCIGAYKFTLNFRRRRVDVQNLVFERHWAINGTSPCLGEYEQEIYRLMAKNRLYAVWDLLYQWLIGADRDAAAYMPSHDWKRLYRRLGSIATAETRFQVGMFVVCIADWDHRHLVGRVAMVTEVRPSNFYTISLKQPPTDRMGIAWQVPHSVLMAISQKRFKAADIYKIDLNNSILAKLDAMKQGTIEDYKKLASAQTRVKLLPYEA